MRRITHGSQRTIWQKQGNGEAVLEVIRRAAKREEKDDKEEGVRSGFHLDG